MRNLYRRLARLEQKVPEPPPKEELDLSALTPEEELRFRVILMKASPFRTREEDDENQRGFAHLKTYLTAKYGDGPDGAVDADDLALVCGALAWSEAIHQAAKGWGLLPTDAPETLLCDPEGDPDTTAVYTASAHVLEALLRAPCPAR